MSGLCGEHRHLDKLNAALHEYAARNQLSLGVYERPPDRLSQDVVALAVTIG